MKQGEKGLERITIEEMEVVVECFNRLSCFVAGTEVLLPDLDDTPQPIGQTGSLNLRLQLLLLAAGSVLVGSFGHRVLASKSSSHLEKKDVSSEISTPADFKAIDEIIVVQVSSFI